MVALLACTDLHQLFNCQLGSETLRKRVGRIIPGLSITAEHWGSRILIVTIWLQIRVLFLKPNQIVHFLIKKNLL